MAEEERLGTAVAGHSVGEKMPEEGVPQTEQGESCGRNKYLAGGSNMVGSRPEQNRGVWCSSCLYYSCGHC